MGGLRKILVCTGYILLGGFLTFGIFLLIQKTSSRENGTIVQAKDSESYFRNVNPNFTIDFVNSEYIRFESKQSANNPFEEKELSFVERLLSYFGIGSSRKGIQIALESVSYDTETLKILEKELVGTTKPVQNFELTQKGENFFEDESVVSKDTIVSKNVYKGVDIEYQVIEGKGLKEEIVLKDLPEYYAECEGVQCILPANSFTFRIVLDAGLSLKRTITSLPGYPAGSMYFIDEEGNYFGHILPEFAVDALGSKTSNLKVELVETEKQNEYLYILTLDHEWLLSEERRYPVRIDPSIVHDNTLSFDMGTYQGTILDDTSTVRLDSFMSGQYISGELPLGDFAILESIDWSALGYGDGDISSPYSEFGVQYAEDYNETGERLSRWQSRAYILSPISAAMGADIDSYSSRYSSLEFWLYARYRVEDIESTIVRTNIGDVKIVNGKYYLVTKQNDRIEIPLEVEFNRWVHISVSFDNESSRATMYVDGKEYSFPYPINPGEVITSISYAGVGSVYGYIDEIRVYNRFLTKYEVISNSNFANIYLFFRGKRGQEWSEWLGGRKLSDMAFTPGLKVYLEDLSENLSNYDLLKMEIASPKEENLYISRNSIEGGEGIPLEESSGILQPFKYFGLQFKVTDTQDSCIFRIGEISGNITNNGYVVFEVGSASYTSLDSYLVGEYNQISLVAEDEGLRPYINGNALEKVLDTSLLVDTPYSLGSECGDFSGEIESVQVSLSEEIDPYSVYTKEDRRYEYRPSFVASLREGELLADKSDMQVYLTEGSTNKSSYYIKNLYKGETIVLADEVDGRLYEVRGLVSSVNLDTGLVEVSDWVGEIPSGGFSGSSDVYKVEEIYVPTKEYLGWYDYINSLYISSSAEIEDLKILSGIKEGDSAVFTDFSGSSILQYKFVFTTKKEYLTPYLSSVNINYTSGGPSMDQVMRHGQWFDEGSKQGFWWSK